MFSGKTSELMKRLRRHLARKQSCLVLKYKKDTRYSLEAVISTHDRSELAAKPVELLEEADNLVWAYDVVAIDEGQFMSDIAKFAEKWANDGKVVIITALDGTFQRRPFATILELLPLAEKVDKLHAVCAGCQGDAAFTQRLTGEAQVEVVGGEDKYRAVCRGCYNKALVETAKQRRRQSIGVVRERDVMDPSVGSPDLPPLMRHLSLDQRQGTPTSSAGARTPFGDVQNGRGGRGTPGSSPATPTSRLLRRSSLSAMTISVLKWLPPATNIGRTSGLEALVAAVENLRGTGRRRWQARVQYLRPVQAQGEAATQSRAQAAKGMYVVALTTDSRILVLRQERQILEADEAILSVLKQLSMHSIRFHFHFEGLEFAVGDFRVRVGQVKVQGTHEVKVIMADVQYCPLEDLDAAQPALKEFVQLLQTSLADSGGRLEEVTPQFSEFALPAAFSAQHAALQYLAVLSA